LFSTEGQLLLYPLAVAALQGGLSCFEGKSDLQPTLERFLHVPLRRLEGDGDPNRKLIDGQVRHFRLSDK
tara:strand:- start:1389 stop:1598 length:210 start_codon:yes stop_codon:yes gene_type:complete